VKHSPRPRKIANLSDSVHHQLSNYALAASAAGVGLLALAQPVEAKIIYTPAHIGIGLGSAYLDLNHDGINDFSINTISSDYHRLSVILFVHPSQPSNGAMVSSHGYAAALKGGRKVGPHSPFNGSAYVNMAWWTNLSSRGSRSGGPWAGGNKKAYLGLKFVVKGKVHYGWVRIRMTHDLYGIITGYAYETIPNKPIYTWPLRKTDDVEESNFGPGASLTNPIPDVPQPASLGMLALGAQGVPLWRRKESVALSFRFKEAL
jgi:hypothetical protein